MSEKDGLVFGYILDGKGGGTVAGWERVHNWKPEDGLLWIHLDYANDNVQRWLNSESGIDPIFCGALTDEDTRPRLALSKDSLLMIMRGVNLNPGADPEDMVALRMWYEQGRVITMRNRKVMAIDDMRKAIEAGKGPATSAEFMAMVANRLVDRMGSVVSGIDDAVDELEDAILTEESYELRPKLSNLRRQSISLRRYMAPQREALSRLQTERVSWLGEAERAKMREVAERTARYIEDIDSARDRASITQEELNNKLSENMNRTMYLLSIVAAIFLPLGLITGLLGINVGGIPGTESKVAFSVVTAMLVGIAVVELWLFKRKKML